ncbi:MAG: pirin family protein, partial [Acidimicrobiales bacterium]
REVGRLKSDAGPSVYAPGEAQGAPDHPHRGFETVTYLLDGEFEHRDSMGHVGVLTPGDVQWMTAGDGVVHSEMPSARIRSEGGRVHGFQLWVNLPAAHKRTPPRYQSLTAADLPAADGPGWTATIVAGSLLGVDGPAHTLSPIGYAHVVVDPGAELAVPVNADHRAAAYVFAGAALAGPSDTPVAEHQLVVFEPGDGAVRLAVDATAPTAADALVLTGRPIGEPVARYGPFVMSTRAELIEAFEDYQAGRMGAIAAVER